MKTKEQLEKEILKKENRVKTYKNSQLYLENEIRRLKQELEKFEAKFVIERPDPNKEYFFINPIGEILGYNSGSSALIESQLYS